MNLSDRKNFILNQLGKNICLQLPQQGAIETGVNSFYYIRKNESSICQHCLTIPMAILIVNGCKIADHGHGERKMETGDLVINCVDSPSVSTIRGATPEAPFLSVYFTLDRKIFAELLGEMQPESRQSAVNNNFVIPAPADFMETILRLSEVAFQPQQAQILGPLILRELHFLLLTGPQGNLLSTLYMGGSKDNRIIDAIAWLKQNLDRSISVETIAKKVHMSVSSLHRHFKSVTGFSPLQYHKELRLHEAQRLMLAENERADMAALAVGYESVTQFNREYKRKFGLPPHRDVSRRKNGFSSENQT